MFSCQLKSLLAEDKIEDGIAACDKQKGSLANVMKAGLERYRALENDKELEKDQKITSMKQALEEATSLELPMMSKNMVILSTIASISVLIGLIGTVLGMIRAFGLLHSQVHLMHLHCQPVFQKLLSILHLVSRVQHLLLFSLTFLIKNRRLYIQN